MLHYTESEIRSQLADSREWLERAILAIYKNGGFGELDRKYLTYAARWIQSGKQLNGKHLRKARGLMMKYAGRLAEMANAAGKEPV